MELDKIVIIFGLYLMFYYFYNAFKTRRTIMKDNRTIIKRQEEVFTKMHETNELLAEIRNSLNTK